MSKNNEKSKIEYEAEIGRKFIDFYNVIRELREPKTGCPWDIKQTHSSVRENFIEETYEAIEAIDHNNDTALCEELGDIMLHIVFHADIAERENSFNITDVIDGITTKLIRRHPHVFGDAEISDSDEVLRSWEKIKQAEKAERRQNDEHVSILDGLPMMMPALILAQRMQQRAARIGFDWKDSEPVWAKVYEELDELRQETNSFAEKEDELGDVLFAIANLARFLNINSEMALRGTIRKFYRRFCHVEKRLLEEGLENPSLEQMDVFWDEAKAIEKNSH